MTDNDEHRGPICKKCGQGFYYDYLDKPEPHEGSGMCWYCWIDERVNQRNHAVDDA